MDVTCFSAINSDPGEPKTFDKAWNHPDEKKRTGWREGISKEFQSIKKKQVWMKIKKDEVPNNRRLIENK